MWQLLQSYRPCNIPCFSISQPLAINPSSPPLNAHKVPVGGHVSFCLCRPLANWHLICATLRNVWLHPVE